MSDRQLAHSTHYREVVHAETGKSAYDGPPFSMSDTVLDVRPAPLLGEHNDYIFRNLLSVEDEEIDLGYVEGYIA